jgi:hypothetical protein
MDALLERVAALEAREAIRDVLYRYARGVDRCDVDLIKSAYHPDAMDVHWTTFVGLGHEFAEYIAPLLATAIVNRHHITNPIIELEGSRAFVESQYVSTHRVALDDERAVESYGEGRYLDVFEERAGEWRIAHRVVINEKSFTREATVQGAARAVNGVQATVGDRDDPVYRRFAIADVKPAPLRGADPMEALRSLYASGAPSFAQLRNFP